MLKSRFIRFQSSLHIEVGHLEHNGQIVETYTMQTTMRGDTLMHSEIKRILGVSTFGALCPRSRLFAPGLKIRIHTEFILKITLKIFGGRALL